MYRRVVLPLFVVQEVEYCRTKVKIEFLLK